MHQSTTSTRHRWQQLTQKTVHLLRRLLPYIAVLLIAFAGLLLYDRYTAPPDPLSIEDVEENVNEMLAEATPAPAYSAQVYDIILPSLVVIQINNFGSPGDSTTNTPTGRTHLTSHLVSSSKGPTLLTEQSFGNGIPVQTQAPLNIGSGVVINDSGAILTAYHIVERAVTIDVIFADGTQSSAAVVAIEPTNNIAVLQAETLPEIFAPATLGNPGALRIGDEAYAVGNPLGLAGSISAGVISGLDRTYTRSPAEPPLERLIQFDSAVNPGSAGGPLLNRSGQVVGIVVGPINPSAQETFIGIGFAVRIDIAGTAAGMPEY